MANREFPSTESGGGLPVPEGMKSVQVIGSGPIEVQILNPTITQSKSGGDKVLFWLAGLKKEVKGLCVLADYSLLPQSLWRLKADMRKLGLLDDIPLNENFTLDDEEIVSRLDEAKGIANFYIDVYEGKEVSKLNNPGFLTKEEAAAMPKTGSTSSVF